MKPIAPLLILALSMTSMGAAEEVRSEDEGTAAAEAAPLEQLDWMVGRWIDQGDASVVTTSCAWSKNRKFLSRSFTITIEGEPTLEGTQVIGWDPIRQQIRSWTFDSEGGFGEGRWLQDGNRWLVKTSFTLATGERASAINVITYVDADTFQWQSTNRELAGEIQPNIPEITVVRQKEPAATIHPEAETSRETKPAESEVSQ